MPKVVRKKVPKRSLTYAEKKQKRLSSLIDKYGAEEIIKVAGKYGKLRGEGAVRKGKKIAAKKGVAELVAKKRRKK